MNYEVKVSYCLGLEGAEKKHTENLFIRCELFAEAEEKAYKYVESQGGDMTDVRTFVAHSITRSGETASNKRADFLYPFVNIGYNTPSWIVNATTAPCEWNAEGKVVPFFCLQPCNNVK